MDFIAEKDDESWKISARRTSRLPRSPSQMMRSHSLRTQRAEPHRFGEIVKAAASQQRILQLVPLRGSRSHDSSRWQLQEAPGIRPRPVSRCRLYGSTLATTSRKISTSHSTSWTEKLALKTMSRSTAATRHSVPLLAQGRRSPPNWSVLIVPFTHDRPEGASWRCMITVSRSTRPSSPPRGLKPPNRNTPFIPDDSGRQDHQGISGFRNAAGPFVARCDA